MFPPAKAIASAVVSDRPATEPMGGLFEFLWQACSIRCVGPAAGNILDAGHAVRRRTPMAEYVRPGKYKSPRGSTLLPNNPRRKCLVGVAAQMMPRSRCEYGGNSARPGFELLILPHAQQNFALQVQVADSPTSIEKKMRAAISQLSKRPGPIYRCAGKKHRARDRKNSAFETVPLEIARAIHADQTALGYADCFDEWPGNQLPCRT